jgi:hypothetical protein
MARSQGFQERITRLAHKVNSSNWFRQAHIGG